MKDIALSLKAIFQKAIDDTYSYFDYQELQRASRLIASARHVVLFGVGDTMASLETFSLMLFKSGIVCTNGYSGNDRFSMGAFLGSKDVAIFASYSGVNLPEFEQQLKGPLSRRCKLIVITSDFTAREHLLTADSLILLPPGEIHSNQGAYFSQTCLRYALSCINAGVMLQTWSLSSQVRERLEAQDIEHASRVFENRGSQRTRHESSAT